MIVQNDLRLFEPLLISGDPVDGDIIAGIIEANHKGQSRQGNIEFRAIQPDGFIMFNLAGQKAKVATSRDTARYLEAILDQKKINC